MKPCLATLQAPNAQIVTLGISGGSGGPGSAMGCRWHCGREESRPAGRPALPVGLRQAGCRDLLK